jgi:hypothetical protein
MTSSAPRVFANPVFLGAVITAFVTLNAGIISFFVSEQQIALQKEKDQAEAALNREKFESELIVSALSTGNPAQSDANLRFLVDVGFIRNHAPELRAFLATHHPAQLPPRTGK